MKMIIPKRTHSFVILLNYAIMPILAWLFAGFLGVPAGLGFAYLVDRLYPRWSIGIERDDLSRGLVNFCNYGIVGSRMFLKMGPRELIVFRGKIAGTLEFGIQFLPDEWCECLSEPQIEELFQRWGGIAFDRQWRLRNYKYVTVSVDGDVHRSLEALVSAFVEASGVELRNVLIRIDYARRNVWGKYGQEDDA